MTDVLDTVLNLFTEHFEANTALPLIGSFGNRFERWFQWECVVAVRQAQLKGSLPEIVEVLLEAEHDYDLLLRGATGSPEVRLELKARSTKGQGPSELANAMMYDQGKLGVAVQAYGGRGASLAFIIAAPGGSIDTWVNNIETHRWLTVVRAKAPPIQTRRIVQAGTLVAALMLFPVN